MRSNASRNGFDDLAPGRTLHEERPKALAREPKEGRPWREQLPEMERAHELKGVWFDGWPNILLVARGSALRGMTRREFLALLAAGTAGAGVSWAQESGGMASRGIRPQPRGRPSGLPFHARFTDVAAHAGLRAPVIYGLPDRMDYILESMGCGVAFLDYDNDGWLDIFLLSGMRREVADEVASYWLYKNN